MTSKHRRFIHSKYCIVCGKYGVDQAHIRSINLDWNKQITGMGKKPSDLWTLPLCRNCHTEQHKMNELKFWEMHGIDPFEEAINYAIRSDCAKIRQEAKKIKEERIDNEKV